jgi:hypothetical protein
MKKVTMAAPLTAHDKIVKARLDDIIDRIEALFREGDAIVAESLRRRRREAQHTLN